MYAPFRLSRKLQQRVQKNLGTGAIGDAAALKVGFGEVVTIPNTRQTNVYA